MAGLSRLLRNPRLVVAEMALLAVVFASTTIGLDHPFTSPLFLGLVAVAAASLVAVLEVQIARAWRVWSRRADVHAVSGAPFRREETVFGEIQPPPAPPVSHVRGAIGVWGSPLFHLGILLILAAGILRALFGADAVVDLMGGEILPARSDAYGQQWPGLLARPFSFPVAVRLEELRVTRYASGETRIVEGSLRLGEGPSSRTAPIAINRPVSKALHTLYLRSVGGAAVLVEARRGAGPEPHAILLRESGFGSEGSALLGDGTVLRVASDFGGIGRIPEKVDVRAVRDGALAAVGRLGSGESLELPDGTRIGVSGIVPWAQLSARRDAATPVVYVGFLLVCAGGMLMMAVVPVESGSSLERVSGGVKLTVWMRPHRFVPLFAPAFDRLWEERSAALEASTVEAGPARA